MLNSENRDMHFLVNLDHKFINNSIFLVWEFENWILMTKAKSVGYNKEILEEILI
jgi:hypothetical protein